MNDPQRKRLEMALATHTEGPAYTLEVQAGDLQALLDENSTPKEPQLDDGEELDCKHCPFGVVRQVWHGWCKKHSHAVWRTQVICRYLSQCDPDDMSDEAKAAHLTILRTGKDPDDE